MARRLLRCERGHLGDRLGRGWAQGSRDRGGLRRLRAAGAQPHRLRGEGLVRRPFVGWLRSRLSRARRHDVEGARVAQASGAAALGRNRHRQGVDGLRRRRHRIGSSAADEVLVIGRETSW